MKRCRDETRYTSQKNGSEPKQNDRNNLKRAIKKRGLVLAKVDARENAREKESLLFLTDRFKRRNSRRREAEMERFKNIAHQQFVARFQEFMISVPAGEPKRAEDFCKTYGDVSTLVVRVSLHRIQSRDPVAFRALWSHCEDVALAHIDALYHTLCEVLRERQAQMILRETFREYCLSWSPDDTLWTVLTTLVPSDAVADFMFDSVDHNWDIHCHRSHVTVSMLGDADIGRLFRSLSRVQDFEFLLTPLMSELDRDFLFGIGEDADEL